MARASVFTWPAPDEDSICLLQQTAGAGSFVLNGDLVNFDAPVFALFRGISRVVSITSAGNISGVDFTISGTLNGSSVSETLAGPNATTVETTQLFDTVTSVTVNGAVGTDTSVGTGTTGATHYFNSNEHASVLGLAIAVNVTNTINYSFQTTLDDVQTNSSPLLFAPITGTEVGHPGFPADMVSQTEDQLAYYNFVTRYSRIIINSSTNGSLVATFLQQGIT
jgi:hypothetical protein